MIASFGSSRSWLGSAQRFRVFLLRTAASLPNYIKAVPAIKANKDIKNLNQRDFKVLATKKYIFLQEFSQFYLCQSIQSAVFHKCPPSLPPAPPSQMMQLTKESVHDCSLKLWWQWLCAACLLLPFQLAVLSTDNCEIQVLVTLCPALLSGLGGMLRPKKWCKLF